MNAMDVDLMRAEDDGMPPACWAVQVGETITGVRHVIAHAPEHDGATGFYSECRCGCQHTAGMPGTVIEVSRELDLVIAEFLIPSPAGGQGVSHKVAFSHAEAQR